MPYHGVNYRVVQAQVTAEGRSVCASSQQCMCLTPIHFNLQHLSRQPCAVFAHGSLAPMQLLFLPVSHRPSYLCRLAEPAYIVAAAHEPVKPQRPPFPVPLDRHGRAAAAYASFPKCSTTFALASDRHRVHFPPGCCYCCWPPRRCRACPTCTSHPRAAASCEILILPAG